MLCFTVNFPDRRLKLFLEPVITIGTTHSAALNNIVKRRAATTASVNPGKRIHSRNTCTEEIAKESIAEHFAHSRHTKFIHNTEFFCTFTAKMQFLLMTVYISFNKSSCFILITMLTTHNKYLLINIC